VPDRELIMQNMLMSEGFVTAKALAQKFAALYASCEEVLAPEKQYDWGLRSIKSVLVVAGQLLRAEAAAAAATSAQAAAQQQPQQQQQQQQQQQPQARLEADVLFRALRDFNVPKILARDLPVFLALLADLFPGDAPERRRDARFEACIAEAAREMGLVPDDEFVLRVVQLSELLAIRHCVFLMGPAGCGRTEARAVLARALQRGVPARPGVDPPVANDYLRPNNGRRVTVREIDPKAVPTSELYGSVHPATREWRDGVLSSAMRDMAASPPELGPQWLVLDGDLDANWIESMNSVMDDNRCGGGCCCCGGGGGGRGGKKGGGGRRRRPPLSTGSRRGDSLSPAQKTNPKKHPRKKRKTGS
jgi:dynein heavy chain